MAQGHKNRGRRWLLSMLVLAFSVAGLFILEYLGGEQEMHLIEQPLSDPNGGTDGQLADGNIDARA